MQGPVLLWAMQSVLPLRTLSGYLEVEEQKTPYTRVLFIIVALLKSKYSHGVPRNLGHTKTITLGVAMVSSDMLIKKQHIIIN